MQDSWLGFFIHLPGLCLHLLIHSLSCGRVLLSDVSGCTECNIAFVYFDIMGRTAREHLEWEFVSVFLFEFASLITGIWESGMD